MEFGISFLIKKGISSLLMPFSIGMILTLLALWLLHKSKYKQAKILLSMSLIWITLIFYAPFANMLLAPLESQYSKLLKIPQDVKYILLLGGDREKRAWEALRLYQAIDDAKIITSGYAFHDKESDALKTAKLLQESGVKSEDIMMQPSAKDTKEEAKQIKKRLGSKPFLLVTAAYHMPRAMMIFQKEGLHPIAAPTDFNNPDETGLSTVWKSSQLEKTEHAWHEYLGLLWSVLRGQISV